jgi:hypothetical protein
MVSQHVATRAPGVVGEGAAWDDINWTACRCSMDATGGSVLLSCVFVSARVAIPIAILCLTFLAGIERSGAAVASL